MTQEIIQMARDSGMELYGLGKDRARFVHHLEAFAKLVAEKVLAEHAMRETQRLGQEKALQALHNENERLGLYKDAYAEQEPVGYVYSESGVKSAAIQRNLPNGTPLYAHPPQRTEQEPVATVIGWGDGGRLIVTVRSMNQIIVRDQPLYLHPPQRPWVGLKEEDYVLVNQLCINPIQAAEFVDRLLKEKNA
jgi:hypothetical protein